MARTESEDPDALAELLLAAACPLASPALRVRLGGWSDERLTAALEGLQRLGAPLVKDDAGIALRLADPLDAAAIRADLPPEFSVHGIEVVRVCSSTNDRVRTRTGQVLCVAEAQSAGRGRRGKAWVQPFGSGLAFSLGVPAPRGRLDPLAIALATAAAGALNAAGYRGIALKWPNDFYARGRKLGGVLVEIEGGASARVVAGLGLNVHAAPVLADRDAVALAELDGPEPRRNFLMAQLAATWVHALERFDADGFAPFAREFVALDLLAGQEITLVGQGDELHGVACGIDELGALMLDTKAGRVQCTAGEVTLGAWAAA